MSARSLLRRAALALLVVIVSLPVAAQSAQSEEATPPEPPAKRRVADWKFIGLTALSLGAAILDVEASQRATNRCPPCSEASSWMLGRRPSGGRMYATILPLKFAETYAAYTSKKKGARGWFTVPSLGGAVNTFGGIRSLSIKPSATWTCPAGGAGCATTSSPPTS